MKKVILRGPCLTQSGYGVHCRQIARWLLERKNIDLKFHALPWGDTPWILSDDSQDKTIERIMLNTTDPSKKQEFDVSFQLQLPNEWDPKLAKINIGITAGVETDICNPSWIENCNSMSAVVVPSKHTAECINRSGKVKVPIHVIPESFCDEILQSDEQKNHINFSTNFNFLVFGQITGDNPFNDRKNVFFTLRWLFELFKDDEDVGIVIKTNLGRNTRIDKKRTIEVMKTLVRECRRGPFPRLHVLHGEMNNIDVASLYKNPKIKALVTATRGEGFGLPILEAAASGLPVIATDWSGHTDFLEQGKYIALSHELKQIHQSRIDEKIFVKDSRWAEVSENEFKQKLKKFRSASAIPRERAEELSKKIKISHNQKAIEKLYDDKLGDLL